MTRWRIGGTARTYKGPGRAGAPAHDLIASFLLKAKAVDELDVVLDLSLDSKLAGCVLKGGTLYIPSSAPATTSTQVYGVGKAFSCAVNLSEVMCDDPLASVRSAPPFAPLRSPSLPNDPRKEKKLIKFSKLWTPYVRPVLGTSFKAGRYGVDMVIKGVS
jgi:hypothetical protein